MHGDGNASAGMARMLRVYPHDVIGRGNFRHHTITERR
jgi:hypothetical protein